MKVKLFRRGRLVGLVNREFHYPEARKKEVLWEKLGIESVNEISENC